MDCPKCGYALTAFDKDCARCRAVAAAEFAGSPASVWPPASGPQTAPAPVYVPPAFSAPAREEDNSSGEERGGPPEIEGLHWNWGAFFCGWLWCVFHRVFGLALLAVAAGLLIAFFSVFILPSGYALPSELMAVVLFGLCCYLGMHGHRLGWERRRFTGGVTQFLAVQWAWAVGGAVAFGVSVLFCVTLGVLFMAAFRAYEARRQADYQAAHPPAASAPVSTAPPPLVLKPPQPAPVRRTFGDEGPRDNSPLDFQRRFNRNSRPIYGPGYRRELDPRFQQPPGDIPNTQPGPPPATAPNPGLPPGSAPDPGGPAGMGNDAGAPLPSGQAAPPPTLVPTPGPAEAAPNGSAGQ